MPHDADVIVVGSGPSGVSVTQPLLEAGLCVALLDGGRRRETELPPGTYHDIRRQDPEQWRLFLGRELEALRPAGPPSPKFDAPTSRFAFEGGASAQRVEGRGFAALVSLARGGLSNIWGAGVASYGDEELADFPFGPADLAPSYERVARRMGLTGFAADDLDCGRDRSVPSQEPLSAAAPPSRPSVFASGARVPQCCPSPDPDAGPVLFATCASGAVARRPSTTRRTTSRS
jgi:choline dehydrogenase-like flavoprotein